MAGEEDGNGRVDEWEAGLPNLEELTPLSQSLVPPDLASAFIISPHPPYSFLDLHRAFHTSLHNLIGHNQEPHHYHVDRTRKSTRLDCSEEEADSLRRNKKKARLLWTPQLHNRFVDVVERLGVNNAVPNTIMQLMNVDGLTRENVASNLRKYRLYRNRIHAPSTEPPPSSSFSSSEHLPPSSHYSSLPMPVPDAFGPQHSMIKSVDVNAHHPTYHPFASSPKRDPVYRFTAPGVGGMIVVKKSLGGGGGDCCSSKPAWLRSGALCRTSLSALLPCYCTSL